MNIPNSQFRSGYGGYRGYAGPSQLQQPSPGTYQRYDTPRGFAGNPPMQRFSAGNRENQRCVKCGLQSHSHPNYCPAINETCYACGKRGHFSRVCRSANVEPERGTSDNQARVPANAVTGVENPLVVVLLSNNRCIITVLLSLN